MYAVCMHFSLTNSTNNILMLQCMANPVWKDRLSIRLSMLNNFVFILFYSQLFRSRLIKVFDFFFPKYINSYSIPRKAWSNRHHKATVALIFCFRGRFGGPTRFLTFKNQFFAVLDTSLFAVHLACTPQAGFSIYVHDGQVIIDTFWYQTG